MKKLSSILLFLLLGIWAGAQNPISPVGVYIADPTARVGKDGKLYVYGSLDVSPEYYCSPDYHVLSSADLKTWTLHPYSFRNGETLYAPDLMEKEGTYYLYYDTPVKGVHAVTMEFIGDVSLDSFRFE